MNITIRSDNLIGSQILKSSEHDSEYIIIGTVWKGWLFYFNNLYYRIRQVSVFKVSKGRVHISGMGTIEQEQI